MIEEVRIVVEEGEDEQPAEGIIYCKKGCAFGPVKIQYLILGQWHDAEIFFKEKKFSE